MPSYSISDIGKGIVNSVDPYSREMGGFSALLSPDRKAAFHRIQMEQLQSLSVAHLENIQETLFQGFTHNIKLSQEMNSSLYQIKGGIDRIQHYSELISKGVSEVCNQLSSTNELLKEILDVISNPSATSSLEKNNLARKTISQSKKLNKEQAKRLIDEAYQLLEASIELCSLNYRAYLDKGWIESFCYNDLKTAVISFEDCVMRSIGEDNSTCCQALRYLADTYQVLGKYSDAVSSIRKALELNSGDRYQLFLELVQYLIMAGEKDIAKKEMLFIINENPEAFAYFATDAFILGDKDASCWLNEIEKEYKTKIFQSTATEFQPTHDYDLSLESTIHTKITNSEKDKFISLSTYKKDLFDKFFRERLSQNLDDMDYISIRELSDNRDKLSIFQDNWLKQSASSLYVQEGYKEPYVSRVHRKKVSWLVKLLRTILYNFYNK